MSNIQPYHNYAKGYVFRILVGAVREPPLREGIVTVFIIDKPWYHDVMM